MISSTVVVPVSSYPEDYISRPDLVVDPTFDIDHRLAELKSAGVLYISYDGVRYLSDTDDKVGELSFDGDVQVISIDGVSLNQFLANKPLSFIVLSEKSSNRPVVVMNHFNVDTFFNDPKAAFSTEEYTYVSDSTFRAFMEAINPVISDLNYATMARKIIDDQACFHTSVYFTDLLLKDFVSLNGVGLVGYCSSDNSFSVLSGNFYPIVKSTPGEFVESTPLSEQLLWTGVSTNLSQTYFIDNYGPSEKVSVCSHMTAHFRISPWTDSTSRAEVAGPGPGLVCSSRDLIKERFGPGTALYISSVAGERMNCDGVTFSNCAFYKPESLETTLVAYSVGNKYSLYRRRYSIVGSDGVEQSVRIAFRVVDNTTKETFDFDDDVVGYSRGQTSFFVWTNSNDVAWIWQYDNSVGSLDIDDNSRVKI